MVKMASGMDHGRVGPTTTTTTTNDVAQHGGPTANTKSCSLGLQRISLILDIHMMLNWRCHIKRSADQYHVIISRAQVYNSSRSQVLTKCWFLIGSRAPVRLTCCKQGRIVWKSVNPSPGLKFIRIITFSFIQFFSFHLCFVYMVIISLKKKPNNKQKTSLQSYKTQIKVLLFPGLA